MSMKKHPLAKPRRWRSGRILLVVGIVAALSIGAVAPTPAGAATSSSLRYSTDGGATWSATATVDAGDDVLVRQWYDNTGSASETGASVRTTVPAGFTLQGGSTQVCLNPSTSNPTTPNASEERCAASNQGAVWSGSSLQISPSAGFYGESNGSTTGMTAFGRKRYLNLHQCVWNDATGTSVPDRTTTLTDAGSNAAWDAGSNVSNTAATSAVCGAGTAPWTPASLLDGAAAYDLLGNRYFNLHQCNWHRTDTPNQDLFSAMTDVSDNPVWHTGSNSSNTADASLVCGAGNFSYVTSPATQGVQALDLRDRRYLHINQCVYRDTDVLERITHVVNTQSNAAYRTGTTTSNSASLSLSCGTGDPKHALVANMSGTATFDLLDTARGAGYVEYALTAPATPSPTACAGAFAGTEAFTQDGTYQSDQTSTATSTGNLTVDFSALSDPCPTDPIPTVDPLVGGALVAAAGAGFLLYRRSRPQLV